MNKKTILIYMIILLIDQINPKETKPAPRKHRGVGTVVAIGAGVIILTVVLGTVAGNYVYLNLHRNKHDSTLL